MRSKRMRRPTATDFSGFTLLELIVVIILLGILSAYIAPRIDIAGSEGRNFADNALVSIRYAQKLAIAQHRTTYVCLTQTSLKVGFDSGCAALAADPGGSTMSFSSTSISISPTPTVSFSFEGIPDAGHTISIAVGAEVYPITIEPQTGYVHP